MDSAQSCQRIEPHRGAADTLLRSFATVVTCTLGFSRLVLPAHLCEHERPSMTQTQYAALAGISDAVAANLFGGGWAVDDEPAATGGCSRGRQ